MDSLYSYFTSQVEKILVYWWKGSSLTPENTSANQNQTESLVKYDVPVTKPPRVLGLQEGGSPAQPVNSHSDHLQIQAKFPPDETVKVDKINLIVKCAGKTTEVDMFPLESISVLLKEACEWAGKKTEKMCLVYDGVRLDVKKTVSQYSLRGGTTVNLIHI